MLPGKAASPSPLFGPLHQLRSQRVPLDVSQCDQKMPIVLDGKALEPTLVQMPMSHRVVGILPALGVGGESRFTLEAVAVLGAECQPKIRGNHWRGMNFRKCGER